MGVFASLITQFWCYLKIRTGFFKNRPTVGLVELGNELS